MTDETISGKLVIKTRSDNLGQPQMYIMQKPENTCQYEQAAENQFLGKKKIKIRCLSFWKHDRNREDAQSNKTFDKKDGSEQQQRENIIFLPIQKPAEENVHPHTEKIKIGFWKHNSNQEPMQLNNEPNETYRRFGYSSDSSPSTEG